MNMTSTDPVDGAAARRQEQILSQEQRWQLTGNGPENYQQYQVPSVFEPLARIFLSRVPIRPGNSVLDVACGTGIVARLAAPIVGTAGRIAAIDLNPGMIEVARKNASAPLSRGPIRARPA